MENPIRLTIIARKDQPIKKIKLTKEDCDAINAEIFKGGFSFFVIFAEIFHKIAGVIGAVSCDSQNII